MATNSLFSRLKDLLERSPVVANVVFVFLMAVAEKILVAEFACPCDPKWNSSFAAAFFVIPSGIAFLLMMMLYRCRRKGRPLASDDDFDKWWFSLLPPLVWQAILFIDGQYFVCAMTDWSGKFYSVDNTYLKWCEPTNGTKSEERMALSEKYFVGSQVIGFGLLVALTVFLTVYVLVKSKKDFCPCIIHKTSSDCKRKGEEQKGHNRGMPGGTTEPGIELQET